MSFWTRSTQTFGGSFGKDGSETYMDSRSLMFYIFDFNTKRVVSFKPFIETLGYAFNYELADDVVTALYRDATTKRAKGMNVQYSFSLNLISHSLSEAKLNLSKVHELVKFKSITTKDETGNDLLTFGQNTFGIYLSNLVSNGRVENGAGNPSTEDEFAKSALFGYIESFKIDESSELGFFEIEGRLYPKIIKLSFDLLVSFRAIKEVLSFYDVNPENDVFLPFKSDGSYYSSDIKYWPFSITSARSSDRMDGKYDYGNNNKTYITISNEKCPSQQVNFLMFMESLNITYESKSKDFAGTYNSYNSYKYKGGNIYKFDLTFSVPAHSINEAVDNMFRFQRLLRIVNNFNDTITELDQSPSSKITEESGKYSLPTDENYKDKYIGKYQYETSKEWKKSTKNEQQEFLRKEYSSQQKTGSIRFNFNNSIPKNLISVSNLINRGNTTLPSGISENGVPCIIETLNFEPELDMGYFEENNKIYFKSYKLTLNCVAVEIEDKFEITPAYTAAGFGENDTDYGSAQNENYNKIMLVDNFNVITKIGD